MSNVVVTGVSTGIGYGVAGELVRRGYRVFGSVRREEDAERLRTELGSGFMPLVFDVTDRGAVLEAAEEVRGIVGGEGLAGLINNAGIASGGPLMHQPLEEVRAQFEVNVVGLISTTQAFLPLLGATKSRTRRPGRVVNIGSIGGKVASPFLSAYTGTKHAVEGISDSLRRELLPYGIDVILIEPGAVRTEMWGKGAAQIAAYDGTDYAPALDRFHKYALGLASKGYSVEAFGRSICDVFEKERPRTRYAIVAGRFSNFTLPALLPDRWLDRIIARNVGLTADDFETAPARNGARATAAR